MTVRQNRSPADALGGTVALFFAAIGGGVQRGRVTIANALIERGVDVTCVMPQAKGPFLERLSPEVAVVDLGTRQPIQLVLRLARWLREARPAALIASQQHAIIAAVWARRLAGVKTSVIVIQHNTLSALCLHSRRRAVRWLLPTAARLFFRWADQVCAVSEGVAADLAALTGMPVSDIRVVHNPTVTPELLEQAKEPSGHPWLDADRTDRPPVILAVGTLNPFKDFALLIRAFARLRRLRPARLVILGEGGERPELERLARELGVAADFDLPGFEPNPYKFMARADVFAVSGRGHAEHDHRSSGLRVPRGVHRLPLRPRGDPAGRTVRQAGPGWRRGCARRSARRHLAGLVGPARAAPASRRILGRACDRSLPAAPRGGSTLGRPGSRRRQRARGAKRKHARRQYSACFIQPYTDAAPPPVSSTVYEDDGECRGTVHGELI